MKRARAYAGATRTTKHGRNICAPTITTLRGVVSKQIKAGGDEIDKLKFSDGLHAHQARSASRAYNRRVRNRRIYYPAWSKFIDKPVGDFERAAISSDIFANHKNRRVAFHLF